MRSSHTKIRIPEVDGLTLLVTGKTLLDIRSAVPNQTGKDGVGNLLVGGGKHMVG